MFGTFYFLCIILQHCVLEISPKPSSFISNDWKILTVSCSILPSQFKIIPLRAKIIKILKAIVISQL